MIVIEHAYWRAYWIPVLFTFDVIALKLRLEARPFCAVLGFK